MGGNKIKKSLTTYSAVSEIFVQIKLSDGNSFHAKCMKKRKDNATISEKKKCRDMSKTATGPVANVCEAYNYFFATPHSARSRSTPYIQVLLIPFCKSRCIPNLQVLLYP
jgi:hypothetical protein